MKKVFRKIKDVFITAYEFIKEVVIFTYESVLSFIKRVFSLITFESSREAKRSAKRDIKSRRINTSHITDKEKLKEAKLIIKEYKKKLAKFALPIQKEISKLIYQNGNKIRKIRFRSSNIDDKVILIIESQKEFITKQNELFENFANETFDKTEGLFELSNKTKILPKRTFTYNQRKVMWGIIFILPWLIGFGLFFVFPFVQSFIYSFFKLEISEGVTTTYIGLDNYKFAINEHTYSNTSYKIELLNTFQDALINIPVLLIFSLFIAVMLNQEFRGRAIVRAIFFIPVILNSGAVAIALGKGDVLTNLLVDEGGIGVIFDLGMYLMNMGIGNSLVTLVVGLISRIYDILTLAGIPILLFLAAIQSVPKHLYEAATIEGATGYEMFWLITLPNVSVHIITVTIYALIDTFLTSDVATIITRTFNSPGDKGLASAMSWIYVLTIILLLLIFFVLAKIFRIGESHYEK